MPAQPVFTRMIRYKLQPEDWWFENSDVLRTFFSDEEIERTGTARLVVQHTLEFGNTWRSIITLTGTYTGQYIQEQSEPAVTQLRFRKRFAKLALYKALQNATGMCPPWGSLTGIRPTRLAYEALEQGEDAGVYLSALAVREDKIALLKRIMEQQKPVWAHTQPNTIGVYIGIPFCKTRCIYCAFPAESLGKKARWVEPYIDALVHEIAAAGAWSKEQSWRVGSVYIGGGTPVSLTAVQLERVLHAAENAFGTVEEYTVEAGRPDGITNDMLHMFGRHHVTRVCVNPQTMCDDTLKLIGRSHTAADVIDACERVRAVLPQAQLNMDLIAGLPGEHKETLQQTITQVLALRPENITLHTLAIKRAARLKHDDWRAALPDWPEAEVMLRAATGMLDNDGYLPYYLYRQKYMMGSLENIGYALPGTACIHNIHAMEERQTILACGAGAISKWVFADHHFIDRHANPKGVEEYVRNVDALIDKKMDIYRTASHIDGHIDE